MHIVSALIFSLIAVGSLGMTIQMLIAGRDRIFSAFAGASLGVDPGYAWVARVRRVARPAPALSRFRPLPHMQPVHA